MKHRFALQWHYSFLYLVKKVNTNINIFNVNIVFKWKIRIYLLQNMPQIEK